MAPRSYGARGPVSARFVSRRDYCRKRIRACESPAAAARTSPISVTQSRAGSVAPTGDVAAWQLGVTGVHVTAVRAGLGNE